MERHIIFRGKTGIPGDDKWYQGSLITLQNGSYCIRFETKNDIHIVPVESNTVGQLFFKEESLEIFEGDFIDTGGVVWLIQWDDFKLALVLRLIEGEDLEEPIDLSKVKVVGNIIDGPKI